MNATKTTTELKSLARELLLGKYKTFILAYVSIQAIILALTMVISAVTSSQSVWAVVLEVLLSFILELISAVFSVGLIRFALHIVRNQPYKVSDIFFAFTSHPDKAIIAKFLLLGLDVVCMLPAVLFCILYYIAQDSYYLILIACLLFAIGLVAAAVFHLSFEMVFYTLVDYPDASVIELFRYSLNVMRGHRIRLFYLVASFLPLFILSVCSLGIGLLFVVPYFKTTLALFYQDVFYITEDEKEE